MLSLVYFKIVNVFSILNMYQKNTKKGTEKNMEKFKVEGVTFYYESQKYYASKCDIKDIDIEKGVDTVVFTAPPSIRYVDIKLSKVKKQFPDVTTLIIENKIQHIEISNFLFPNIKNVISKNEMFENGNLLLERNYGKDGYNLLNAFCKGPEELIDLSKVIRVRSYAFEGCRSKNIVNAGNISSMDVKSFSGSIFAMDNDYEKGIKAIGRFLIGIDYSIPVIEIPETVTENACNFDECKTVKEIVLKNDSSIDALHNCYYNAIICDKSIRRIHRKENWSCLKLPFSHLETSGLESRFLQHALQSSVLLLPENMAAFASVSRRRFQCPVRQFLSDTVLHTRQGRFLSVFLKIPSFFTPFLFLTGLICCNPAAYKKPALSRRPVS